MTASPRPTALTAAFWCLLAGAVLMLAGGLMTATVDYRTLREAAPATVSDQSVRDTVAVYRGTGIMIVAFAAVLITLTGRVRGGDARSRRAVLVLGLLLAVLLSAAAALQLAPVSVLVMLGLLPIIVGVLLLSRPVVAEWFAGIGPGAPEQLP